MVKRVLQYNGLEVNHIMNITDVGHLTDDADGGEDKMEKGARREGQSAYEIAQKYTDAFFGDLEKLNILSANEYPKATDHIDEQIDMVQKLIDNGFTYETTDGIYFDSTKASDYGKLALLDRQNLKGGVRVDLGEKKNPHDFAIWKFSNDNEQRQMEWDAFGKKGFPGWHIECSAMSSQYLGDHFDIHTGGVDHIPVHHTNEIAQSEAVFEKKPWVNYWLHGEFLLINSDRMGKSEGNFITMNTLTEKGYSGLDFRFLILQTHYKKQLNFSWEALSAAQSGLRRLHNIMRDLQVADEGAPSQKYTKKFQKHINDDLDIPGAIALMWDMLRSDINDSDKRATLRDFDTVLGLLPQTEWSDDLPEQVTALLEERLAAREKEDWDRADRLRDQLQDLGYTVEDTDTGQRAVKV